MEKLWFPHMNLLKQISVVSRETHAVIRWPMALDEAVSVFLRAAECITQGPDRAVPERLSAANDLPVQSAAAKERMVIPIDQCLEF